MQPRLIKVSIPKETLARRQQVDAWLIDHQPHIVVPAMRCTADALRVATSYVLRSWSSWKGEDGTAYRALAASPTGQRGLVLDINVQVRTAEAVEYTANVCRLEAKDNEEPRMLAGGSVGQFVELYHALSLDRLLDIGTAHLFDQDLRRLCADLLAGDAEVLWPGVWLCLKEGPGMAAIALLGTLVSRGAVTLKTLTLEQSAANRSMLAEELAREYLAQLERLTKRLGYPKPNLEAIERDYMALCMRVRQAEELLGTPIPCLEEQMVFEEALASVPA